MVAHEACLIEADGLLVSLFAVTLGFEVQTDEVIGLSVGLNGGVEDTAIDLKRLASELVLKDRRL